MSRRGVAIGAMVTSPEVLHRIGVPAINLREEEAEAEVQEAMSWPDEPVGGKFCGESSRVIRPV
jgi:hypothetical protein